MARCLIILDDVCFPTNSGGRFLAWQDSLALTDLYDEANAIIFHHASESPSLSNYMSVFKNVHFIPRKSFLASTAAHPLTPYQASSRKLSRKDLDIVRSWGCPDSIVAHHEWTSDVLSDVGQQFPSALRVLRSHNHEGRFLRSLARDASGLRRLYLELETIRTSGVFLKRAADRAHTVWILAEEDRDAYSAATPRVHLVPPSVEIRPDLTSCGPSRDLRVGFLGALDMPQAVAGLTWFISEVWPQVRKQQPCAVLAVAGRRAQPAFSKWMESVPGVEFYGEIPDSQAFISSLRLFINPVFSGSGINIKMLEPAAMALPIVSTRIGLRGLPGVSGGLGGFDSAHDFALACAKLLNDHATAAQYGLRARESTAKLSRASVSALMANAIANQIHSESLPLRGVQ